MYSPGVPRPVSGSYEAFSGRAADVWPAVLTTTVKSLAGTSSTDLPAVSLTITWTALSRPT